MYIQDNSCNDVEESNFKLVISLDWMCKSCNFKGWGVRVT